VSDEKAAEPEVFELPSYEYLEDWANLADGWADMLSEYGAEGWQLKFVLIDETEADKRVVSGRRRLIFERECAEDADGG